MASITAKITAALPAGTETLEVNARETAGGWEWEVFLDRTERRLEPFRLAFGKTRSCTGALTAANKVACEHLIG